MKNDPKAAARMARARVRLLTQVAPFYGMILMRLAVREGQCDTMCTDGVTITYSPDFVETLNDDELMYVLAHEAGHVANCHPFREKPHHDHSRANIAMDHAVNLILNDYTDKTGAQPFKMPAGGCADPRYTGMAWEEIYDLLPADAGQGGPGMGEVKPHPEPDPNKRQEAEAHLIQAVAQAAQAYGNLPADIARMVEEMRKPVVHWPDVLRQFLTRATNETSWKRPARRSLAAGMYRPAKSGVKCPPLVVAIDTSGSISAAQLAAFGAEISAIHADVHPERLHVVYCDSRVNHTDEFAPEDQVQIEPHGGGGTRFSPVFDWVENNLYEAPAALVYLTDLDGPAPHEPDYPVLWVSTDRHARHPFGERVDLP